MSNYYDVLIVIILIYQTWVMLIYYKKHDDHLSLIAHHLIELKRKLTMRENRKN